MAALGDAATIQVRGNGTVRAEPDEAMLWITLTATAESPGPALADVAARSNSLAALLEELGVDRADRTTAGITVHEEFDHTQQGRRSLGHRAATQVALRLTDPMVLGGLVSRAADELGARVEGPRWQIAPDNPVRLEAAREAARDAERKARAYAEGIGAKLGGALRLTEPEDAGMPRRVAMAAAGARFDPVAVDPGEHEVVASIEVTFALEPA